MKLPRISILLCCLLWQPLAVFIDDIIYDKNDNRFIAIDLKQVFPESMRTSINH